MSMHQSFPVSADGSVLALRNAHVAESFAAWLREDGERLVEAAELLGGPKWAARALVVVNDVVAGALPADRLADLRALRRLLRLEFIDDPASAEAAFFAAVDPDDPRADAARLWAEGLDRGVAALVAPGGSAASRIEETA